MYSESDRDSDGNFIIRYFFDDDTSIEIIYSGECNNVYTTGDGWDTPKETECDLRAELIDIIYYNSNDDSISIMNYPEASDLAQNIVDYNIYDYSDEFIDRFQDYEPDYETDD